MNRKQLTLLIALLVVLGAAGILVQSSRNKNSEAGEAGTGKKLLGNKFPVNDVAHIVIKGLGKELNLVKKDETWRVRERGDYPANFAQISEFIIKVSDLKAVQREDIGKSQLGRMQLLEPGEGTNSGTLLELEAKDDKVLGSLLLGKKHVRKMSEQEEARFGGEGFPDGRYVMTGNDKTHALLVGDPLNNAETKPETWLNKDFFRVEKLKSVAVTFPAVPTNSWKLTRDTEAAEWKLADPKKDEKLDSSKASGETSAFASPAFNDVVTPPVKPEEHGLDKPVLVKLETFDNFDYTVKVGKKTADQYPVEITVTANLPKERAPAKDEKPEDKEKAVKAWKEAQKHLEDKLKREQGYANWVYLMPNWNVDPVIKERKDLLEEKKEEGKKDNKAAADDKKGFLTPTDDLLGTPEPEPAKKP
jgi:hypothetical protein